MGSMIDFTIGNIQTTAYTSLPEGQGAFPGVVVAFHKDGIDPFTKWLVDDLARNGYAAIAPNHYHILPSLDYIDRRKEYLDDDQLTADIQASVDWLVRDGNADRDRLALIGHCMGGRTTWAGLVGLPNVFKCGCPYYSGGSFLQQGQLPAPMDRLENITCPVMGFFGNDDKNPSPADVEEFSRRLTALNKEHEFHRYDGAGHAFMDWTGKSFNERASRDAWAKTLNFLSQHIGGNTGATVFPYD